MQGLWGLLGRTVAGKAGQAIFLHVTPRSEASRGAIGMPPALAGSLDCEFTTSDFAKHYFASWIHVNNEFTTSDSSESRGSIYAKYKSEDASRAMQAQSKTGTTIEPSNQPARAGGIL